MQGHAAVLEGGALSPAWGVPFAGLLLSIGTLLVVQRAADLARNTLGHCGLLAGTWQVGGPLTADAGLYSTSSANLTYVADNPAQRMGVTDLQVTGYQYNTFAQTPQLSWTTGGAACASSFSIRSAKTALSVAASTEASTLAPPGAAGVRTDMRLTADMRAAGAFGR